MKRFSIIFQSIRCIQQQRNASGGVKSRLQWNQTDTCSSGRSFSEAALNTRSWLLPGSLSLSPRLAHMLQVHGKRLASKLQQAEQSTRVVVCSVTDTSSGQRLLAGILPLAAMVYLFPARFHARAWEMPRHEINPSHQRKTSGLSLGSLLSRIELPLLLRNILEEMSIWLRGLYLGLIFIPVVTSAPLVFMMGINSDKAREMWMDLLLWTIEHAGPAFIKWAQWSSSRPDLFPRDLCQRFERLQTSAPSHEGQHSTSAITAAFEHIAMNNPLFDSFEEEPVASGSIAQVHRARLSAYGAALTGRRRGQLVAVKVRHPGVTSLMHRDFVLMQRMARLCCLIPGLQDLRLDESIRQFGGPLKEQLNLAIEAQHLERFNHNFRRWHHVSFPHPLFPLVAPDVLVETFEEGDLISTYVNLPEPSKQRSFLAATGLNLYLQMLLKDNFCHADLHPGNILVKEVDYTSLKGLSRLVTALLNFELKPHLVLLDAGMIAELKPLDQRNLVDFFRALTRQDGENIARSILTLSEKQTCKNPAAFVTAIKSMFENLDPDYITQHTDDVFKDMIETLRQHQVTLKSTVSTIVVTTLVLEGWASKLDSDLHILDTMRDILGNDWSERISRVVDKIINSHSLEVVQ